MPFVKTPKIPRATIQRLSVYLEALNTLAHDGAKVVSSEAGEWPKGQNYKIC